MNPKKICILGLNAYLNAASDKLYQKITQSIIITIMSIIIFTSDLSENWRVQQSPDQLAAQSQHHPWSIANINHVSHNYE